MLLLDAPGSHSPVPYSDQWLGHSVGDKLQPCVSGLSRRPRVCVLSRSQFNSLYGTEEIKRDTKSLDLGQQHTRTKDDLITYLCLGMAIGHFLSGGGELELQLI